MSAARVAAQAKVNLFLRVLAREASGFHQIETLFQRLALADDVTVRTDVRGRALDVRGADTGPVEQNLAWRAAQAYATATGWPDGFAVEIDKRIPVGGGLGGGSADAGAVLRLLNHLAPTPLPPERLLELALPLGADVPFLTGEQPLALAWGRGERLLELAPLPPRTVGLLLPPVAVPTGEAYGWVAADRGAFTPAARRLSAAQLADWAGVVALAGNDFEGPVTARVPAVAALADARSLFAPPLPAGFVPPIYQMSGSGSTWFVLVADHRLKLELSESEAWRTVWTETVDRVAPVERLP